MGNLPSIVSRLLKPLDIISKLPHIRLGILPSLGCALLSSAIITYFVFILQPFPTWLFEEVLYESGWVVVWLNLLPVVVSVLALYFLTNNIVLSAGIVGFTVVALSVMNRFKIIFRHAPLTTMDFMLSAEFMGISHSFTPRLIWGTAGGVGLIILAIAVAALFIRNKPMLLRIRIAGLGAALAAGMYTTAVLGDVQRWDELYVHGNIWRMEDHFNSKGFLYAFIHTHLTTEISTPEGFDTTALLAQLLDESFLGHEPQAESAEPILPHVFLILAEAFSEISESEGISFPHGRDPLANYRAIRQESLHGYMVVPHYGGGTADTEFDILTGISTRNFRGAPFSNTLITRRFPGLVRVLSGLGYHPQAMHPGFYWFYDRTNAFEFLGFDNFKPLEEFYPQPPMVAGYASEEATFDVMLERFNYHLENRPGVPLFEKVITIQNHGPYEYKHDHPFPFEFESYPELLPNEMNLLSNFFYGLEMVDEQLGRLVEYMRNSPEPVVIIYYSDHLPLLTRGILDAHISQDYAFGRYLPEAGEQLRDFTVPFIIWSNPAARGQLQAQRTEEPRLDTPISSFYLGSLILAYLGLEQHDPFFYFLHNLRHEFPVQLEWHYFDTEGNRFYHTQEQSPSVRLYRHWSYYRLLNYQVVD